MYGSDLRNMSTEVFAAKSGAEVVGLVEQSGVNIAGKSGGLH